MIPQAFSINYPAAACFIILAIMAIYHLIVARRQEFETTILPSALNVQDNGHPISIWTEKDLAVNCPLTLDQLRCGNLTIGPKGILQVREVVADRIVNHGHLMVADKVDAKMEVIVTQKIHALRIETPRLVLKKKAEAYIQVVTRQTQVVRSRKAHTRGFFNSFEEFQKAQRVAQPVDAASFDQRQRVVAATKVHILRK